MLKPDYETFDGLLKDIIADMRILAGDAVGPSNASWQDVAGTLATNMEVYARLLHRARQGDSVYPAVFPSVDDVCEKGVKL